VCVPDAMVRQTLDTFVVRNNIYMYSALSIYTVYRYNCIVMFEHPLKAELKIFLSRHNKFMLSPSA